MVDRRVGAVSEGVAAVLRRARPVATRRTRIARFAARATATSVPSSKALATFTSVANVSNSLVDPRPGATAAGVPKTLFTDIPTPARSRQQLDAYVIDQDRAKKVLSVAVHSHYKRLVAW